MESLEEEGLKWECDNHPITHPYLTVPCPSPETRELPVPWDSETQESSLLPGSPWSQGWQLCLVRRKGFGASPLEKDRLWEDLDFSRSHAQELETYYCLYSPRNKEDLNSTFQTLAQPGDWFSLGKPCEDQVVRQREKNYYNKPHRIVQILFLQWAFHKTDDPQLSSFLELWHSSWEALLTLRFLRDLLLDFAVCYLISFFLWFL